jgi:hypothetical protein
MDLEQIEASFQPIQGGVFMRRWGAGHADGVAYSQRKLCLVATDKALLAGILLELSRQPDCYFVKYSVQSRDGMYLGRCFMLDDRRIGDLWRELKAHPQLMCSVQDDDFTRPFREAG